MENGKTMELLGYQEFLTRMKDSVMVSFGTEYRVDINHVLKNNAIELDGLIILKENERITPNIYLNSYYERYVEGEELSKLVEEIIGIYMDTMEDGEKEALCLKYEFEEMKNCIIYRLVNYNKNSKLLQEVPHIRFLDLAITFHCLVKNNNEGIGTIRITNEHMMNWETNIEELKTFARANTPEIFPAVMKSMNDVILEILKKEMKPMPYYQDADTEDNISNQLDVSAEELMDSIKAGMEHQNCKEMYVLSNEKGINGASCLLYPDIIKELAEELETDFYILPSSIHEIILVMDNENINKYILKDMVLDVNRTQVPEEDILSDSVYFYSREKDAISM